MPEDLDIFVEKARNNSKKTVLASVCHTLAESGFMHHTNVKRREPESKGKLRLHSAQALLPSHRKSWTSTIIETFISRQSLRFCCPEWCLSRVVAYRWYSIVMYLRSYLSIGVLVATARSVARVPIINHYQYSAVSLRNQPS